MSLDKVVNELSAEGAPKLNHVEETSDRSQPAIEPGTHVGHWNKGEFLKEVESGCALKHVEAAKDRSEPRIDPDVHVQPSRRGALLSEVKVRGGHHAVVSELSAACAAGGPALAHVDAPADRSAPVVQGASVGKWDKSGFLHEIEAPKPLKHVDQVSDRSQPLVEPDVKIKRSSHSELLSEIKSSSPRALRHVEEAADRSEPRVTHTAALRVHSSGELH